MFANERRAKIVELIQEKQSVTVSELMNMFGVSIETVRRDLEQLEQQRALIRVHGGAMSYKKMHSFKKLEKRMSENKILKQQLAKTTVQFICENDMIAIDSGSTAMELIPILKESFHKLTIVTNSPEVFDYVCDVDGFELILVGGQYLPDEKAFYGHIALDAINRLHVSKAFIFPSAVSLQHGVGTFVHELFEIQRAYIENADEVFILADSSKFETTAKIKLCDLLQSYKLITDSKLSDDIYTLYREHAVNIIK